MARDIQKRLGQLQSRRRGLDRPSELTMDSLAEVLAKRDMTESYQQRSTFPYTQYTLGAMQQVGHDYTRVGLEEAARVGKQLSTGLGQHGISVAFELQGSVPLNIHIRGVSDVDLLTLHTAFVTYDGGRLGQTAGYYTPVFYSVVDKMRELRLTAETVLSSSYPKATVDKSGNKAIKISGGSLRRAVDVVPAHWHDSTAWQISQEQHDRGVKVYNKGEHSTFMNMPFKHIKVIHERDTQTLGGLKKTIRLCKNVKSDGEADGKNIAISSYEIASLMWHVDPASLIVASFNELTLLAFTQRHLDSLARNIQHAAMLITPDGSRRILDTSERLLGLVNLSAEMTDLAAEVAKEQDYMLRIGTPPTPQQIHDALRRAQIAA